MERPAGAEEKAWGWTLLLWQQSYTRPNGEVGTLCRGHRVWIRRGGFSSIHLHEQQQNLFFVNRGVLQLRDFIMDGQVPVPVGEPLRLGQDDRPVTFNEGVPHQFYAETDVLALEIYFAVAGGTALPSDIVRFSENGPRNLGTLMGSPVVTVHDIGLRAGPGDIAFMEMDAETAARAAKSFVPPIPGKFFIVPGSVDSP